MWLSLFCNPNCSSNSRARVLACFAGIPFYFPVFNGVCNIAFSCAWFKDASYFSPLDAGKHL